VNDRMSRFLMFQLSHTMTRGMTAQPSTQTRLMRGVAPPAGPRTWSRVRSIYENMAPTSL